MLLKKKYTFVTSNRNFDNEIFLADKTTYYYQVCTYPDTKTGRFHMRRFLMDGDNFIKDLKYFYLTKDQLTLFYTKKRPNIYKTYPMNNFDTISAPTDEELDMARSELFTMDVDNTNYYNLA